MSDFTDYQKQRQSLGVKELEGAQGVLKRGTEVLAERLERLEERVRELEKWQEWQDARSDKVEDK